MSGRVVVIGGGFVGVLTAMALSGTQNGVVLLERDGPRRCDLARGKAPFFEPGVDSELADLVTSGRVTVPTRDDETKHVLQNADIAVFCVGTPPGAEGEEDIRALSTVYLERAVMQYAQARNTVDAPESVVIVRSTVPPGTCRYLAKLLGEHYTVVHWPEFMAEGEAWSGDPKLRQARPSILGLHENWDAKTEANLRRFCGVDRVGVWEVSEIAKMANNAMLATRLSVVNEIAGIAMAQNVDVGDVLNAISADDRIGRGYLASRSGFGGSCLPKDVAGLAAVALDLRLPCDVLAGVSETNDIIKTWAAEVVGRAAGKHLATPGAILVLGVAFKPGTSDIRNSPAVAVIEELASDDRIDAECHRIYAHDPCIGALEQLQEALTETAQKHVDLAMSIRVRSMSPTSWLGPDAVDALSAIVLMTPWPMYLTREFFDSIPMAVVIVDACRGWPRDWLTERAAINPVHRWGDGSLPRAAP